MMKIEKLNSSCERVGWIECEHLTKIIYYKKHIIYCEFDNGKASLKYDFSRLFDDAEIDEDKTTESLIYVTETISNDFEDNEFFTEYLVHMVDLKDGYKLKPKHLMKKKFKFEFEVL